MSIVVNIVQYTSIIRIIIDRFIIFSGSKAISVPLNLVKKSWTSRARKITDNDLLREKSFRIGHFFKNFTSFSFWSFVEAIFYKMFCNFLLYFDWNSLSSTHRQFLRKKSEILIQKYDSYTFSSLLWRKWCVIFSYLLDSEPFERNCMARIISYFEDYETFERDWIARNISYFENYETDKNLSHKEKFLFYGPYCMLIEIPSQYNSTC